MLTFRGLLESGKKIEEKALVFLLRALILLGILGISARVAWNIQWCHNRTILGPFTIWAPARECPRKNSIIKCSWNFPRMKHIRDMPRKSYVVLCSGRTRVLTISSFQLSPGHVCRSSKPRLGSNMKKGHVFEGQKSKNRRLTWFEHNQGLKVVSIYLHDPVQHQLIFSASLTEQLVLLFRPIRWRGFISLPFPATNWAPINYGLQRLRVKHVDQALTYSHKEWDCR